MLRIYVLLLCLLINGLCVGGQSRTSPTSMLETFQSVGQLDNITRFCLKKFGFEKIMKNLHQDIDRELTQDLVRCPNYVHFETPTASSSSTVPVCDLLLPHVYFGEKIRDKLKRLITRNAIPSAIQNFLRKGNKLWAIVSFLRDVGASQYSAFDPASEKFTYVVPQAADPQQDTCNFCGPTGGKITSSSFTPDIATFPVRTIVNGKRKTNYFSCCDMHDSCYASGVSLRTCDAIFFYCVADYYSIWAGAKPEHEITDYYAEEQGLANRYIKGQETVWANAITKLIKVKNAPLLYMFFVALVNKEKRVFKPLARNEVEYLIFYSGCIRSEWLNDHKIPSSLRLLPTCVEAEQQLCANSTPNVEPPPTAQNTSNNNTMPPKEDSTRPKESLVNLPTGASYVRTAFYQGKLCEGTPIRYEYTLREKNTDDIDTSCKKAVFKDESHRDESLTNSIPMSESAGWLIFQRFDEQKGYNCPSTPTTVTAVLKDFCYLDLSTTSQMYSCTDSHWELRNYAGKQCDVFLYVAWYHSLSHEGQCFESTIQPQNYFCG